MIDGLTYHDHGGCRFACRLSGNGIPVLLIQGTGVQGDGWQPQVAGLVAQCQCLTFDNRGMGQSQPTGTLISVAQMAEDARVLMDMSGWSSAHVVGHSLGGPIGLQLALDAPERVRSLALLCTFARGRDVFPLTPRTLGLALRMQIGPLAQRRRAFLNLVMRTAGLAVAEQDALAEHLGTLFGHDLAVQPPIANQQLAALRACDLTTRLGEIATPTLVVSATYDPIAPPKLGHVLARGIREAIYVEIPDASHAVTVQYADRINELLMRHLLQAEQQFAGLSSRFD